MHVSCSCCCWLSSATRLSLLLAEMTFSVFEMGPPWQCYTSSCCRSVLVVLAVAAAVQFIGCVHARSPVMSHSCFSNSLSLSCSLFFSLFFFSSPFLLLDTYPILSYPIQDGDTALILAVNKGNQGMVQLLVEQEGIDLNLKNSVSKVKEGILVARQIHVIGSRQQKGRREGEQWCGHVLLNREQLPQQQQQVQQEQYKGQK